MQPVGGGQDIHRQATEAVSRESGIALVLHWLTQRLKVKPNSECLIILKRVGTLGFTRLRSNNKILFPFLSLFGVD